MSKIIMTFGIQPKHIEEIEKESKEYDDIREEKDKLEDGWILYDSCFWKRMGDKFGWCPLTLALYYFRHKNLKEEK